MPTKPTPKNLAGTSADIINATRNELGGTFADQVPMALKAGDMLENGQVASQADSMARLRSIGEVLTTYQPLANAFLSALVNRIGRVILSSRLYENPWAGFKKGLLEYGETVEEIFVNITKAHQFNPEQAEETIFKREIPDVRAVFHSMNYQKFYKVTVSNDQLRQAFLSWQGVSDLISKIIETLYTSANYDEFIVMKYLIAYNALRGRMYPMNIPAANADNASSIIATLKGVSNSLEFMSTKYNYAGVATYTDRNYQYFIMNAKFNAIVDVEVLARAFNLDRAELMGRTVLVDDFSLNGTELERLNELLGNDPNYTPFTQAELNALSSIPCVLVDQAWFMIFDNYFNMTEQYNGEGLYWQYWYHAWKTFSTSPFNTAIVFTDQTPAVTSVTVTPATATVTKGQQLQLASSVETTGFAPKNVTWAITETNTTSSISASGVLAVAADEPNATLTITATSDFDNTKAGTATITISA